MYSFNFVILDKNLDVLNVLDAVNIQWRRKYYDYGQFEVQIIAEDYEPDMQYIWHIANNEVGIVEKVVVESKAEGIFINLSGHFIEFWLSRGIVISPLSTNTRIDTICKDLVNNRIISDLHENRIVVGDCQVVNKTADSYPENETEVGAITTSLLKSADFSQKLEFDYDAKKFSYRTWQGIDRTIAGANQCTFSDKLGNVSQIKYDYDESDYKNYCDIRIDRGENAAPQFIYTSYSNAKPGEPLSKMFLDISDTESARSSIAIAAAKQKALLELLNHIIITNITFTPLTDWYEYKTNYDLGDKVKCVVSAVEQSYSFRITEIDELYKQNQMSIELQFGDMKKLNYMKGRY